MKDSFDSQRESNAEGKRLKQNHDKLLQANI